MKKSTKGSIAAGAAGVLLLGGLGSLAFWSDSETIAGGSVTAGTLALSEPVCATTPGTGWVYAAGNAGAGTAANLIVPGDTIAKECTFVISATGDNLKATLTIPDTTIVTGTPAGTTLDTVVSATYASSGAPIDGVITSANGGNTVTATIRVAFDFGNETTINANDMQGVLAQLDAIPINLTQVNANLP